MRLNLGCGSKILAGWHNVDKYPTFAPDEVVDLEVFPWPWPDHSVDEVLLSHVLEHLGATTEVYLGIIKELYRVCRDGAKIVIAVPHPRHDNYLGDPTHVRPITPDGMMLFSQAANREWLAKGTANTTLGLYLGVDLKTESISYDLSEPWRELHELKKISKADLQHAIRSYNNVIQQITFVMVAIKPAGRTSTADIGSAQPVEVPLSPG
jgi:ubiquinone/menaquinone biosynthesis C-methylase UbiE